MTITVTIAAESYQLISLAQFKLLTGITTTTDDTKINAIIDRVSAQIATYCNRENPLRSFALQTYSETLSGSGGKNLLLTNTPIRSITSITYNGDVVDSSYYSVDEPGIGIVRNDNRWNYTCGNYLYTVVYQAGYILPSFVTGTPNLPLDIAASALEMVKSSYDNSTRDTSISKESVPDVYTVEYGSSSSSSVGGSSSNSSGSSVSSLLSGLGTIGSHRRFNI